MGLDFDDTPNHSILPLRPSRADRFSAIAEKLLDTYEASADPKALELAYLAQRAAGDAAELALLQESRP